MKTLSLITALFYYFLPTVSYSVFRNNYSPNDEGKFTGVKVLFFSKILSTLTIFYPNFSTQKIEIKQKCDF